MPVDTSIYNVPQQPNALQQAATAVGVANAAEQNKLLQGQQVQQQTQIDAAKLELVKNQLGQFRSMLAPLLNTANPTTRDITSIATEAIKNKMTTPQQVVNVMASWPGDKATPEQRKKWIENIYVQTLGHEQQIGMVLGGIQGTGTGGGTTFTQQPMLPGRPARQTGAIPNTLPPGTPVYNPKTRQMEISPQGEPGTFQPAMPPRPAGPSAVTPGAGLPKPDVRVGGPAPAKEQARLPAGAPMGEGSAADRAAAQAGEQLAADRANNADYVRQVFPLEQAIPKLEKLGKTGTGPGAEELNNVKSFLQTLGIPGFDQSKIKNFDEAHKYLTDWVMANGNASTNDKLAASFASNASTKISNAAAVDVAKSALAIRRMKKAQQEAFEATGLPESQYTRWASQWNAKQDPRVYGFDMMSPKQRMDVLKSLPAAKRDAFMFDVQNAEQMGLIKPPAPAAKPQSNVSRNPGGA